MDSGDLLSKPEETANKIKVEITAAIKEMAMDHDDDQENRLNIFRLPLPGGPNFDSNFHAKNAIIIYVLSV